ncbi:MAG: leucyl aminopeptidase [Coprobacillaceae bacterium]
MIKQSMLEHIKDSNISVLYPIYEEKDICSKIRNGLGYELNEEVNRELGKVTTIYTLGKFPFKSITFVGLGKEEDITTTRLQKAFGALVKSVKEDAVVVDIRRAITDSFDLQTVTELFCESQIMANYEFTKIGTDPKEEIIYEIIGSEDISSAIEKGVIIGEAVNHARTLGNMPSNYMTPIELVAYAEDLAKDCHLEATILSKKELEEMGAGGILGVNQGSVIEARMIVLKYNGAGNEPYTALVGKGITFDSGGYNLKPSASMTTMKSDMCGAANVLGAMEVIAKRKLKGNVIAVIPTTENMISGEAFNCDDVLVSLSKKTVEITNTDAEGRLILMDGITYAQKLGAKRIIDIATLTGAVIAALSQSYTGTFSNNEEFYQEFVDASKRSNEKIWRLPLDEDYHDMLKKSKVADIVNSASGGAGSSVAACFLEEFVEEGIEWIHLDIAGTSYDAKYNVLANEGATGAMVKSMAALFEK